MESSKMEKLIMGSVPFPACVVENTGKIIYANSNISNVFIYDGIKDASFFALTGIKYEQLLKVAETDEYLIVKRNNRDFRIACSKEGADEFKDTEVVFVYFIDVTNFESLKDKYNEEKTCMIIVSFDNYDELVNTNSDKNMVEINSKVDCLIRNWGDEMDASVNRLSKSLYIIFAEYKALSKSIDDKFPILDEVRKIETESDFPLSLSLGIGIGRKTIAETEANASVAMDLALGRGGDQAVVKRGNAIEYFGGMLQSVEKGNKGKSRIVAHALKQLIRQSNKVFIMGHKYPDMDAFGASLGINRMCEIEDRESYIIINEYNDALKEMFDAAKETENYYFINNEKALSMVDDNSLVIILDTNRLSLVECQELLNRTDKVAIIDHHRRAEDYIENTTLAYVESYASSTCELVAEMIQSTAPKKTLIKLEAEALLAGMTIDTNRFAVKTGVRTFEAASWLRRSGADTTEVKKYFQTDLEDFKVRANCIANAHFYRGQIAVSIFEGNIPEIQIINSQVADELLNIKGIKATFVIGKNQFGRTVISARSLGDINVQLIMEKFGGGGHLTTAGAQLNMEPEKVLEKLYGLVDEVLDK